MNKKSFPPELQSKYLRVPFRDHGTSFRGCDCGGLVWLIYKTELGIELPNWKEMYSCTQIEYATEMEQTIDTMLDDMYIEVPFEEKQPYDVVTFSIRGYDVHVGMVVDDERFIHIMQGRTGVVVERFDSLHWRNRITGCFRYNLGAE